jgi:3-oxoacyl-[acyl-carrier protein] reductase
MSFSGRVAVVTGAGHGIGEATAKLLAERGVFIVCNALSDSCERVAKEIVAKGGKAVSFVCDVTDQNAVKTMIDQTAKRLGRLDILVSNAGWWGVPRHQKIEDVKVEDWNRVLDVNLIGSGAGVVWSRTGIHAYTAAKAALGGLTRQLAKELAPLGINVNCVASGLVRSRPEHAIRPEDMTLEERAENEKTLSEIPARRIGMPMDIATVIAFMASDEAGYIHGQTLLVDGGHWMK